MSTAQRQSNKGPGATVKLYGRAGREIRREEASGESRAVIYEEAEWEKRTEGGTYNET